MQKIKLRTTASMTRGAFFTRDAVHTAVTHEEGTANAARVAQLTGLDLGLVYDGIKRGLDMLEADDRRQIVQKLYDAYQGSPSGDPSSPTVIVDNRARATDGASSAAAMRDLVRSINRANTDVSHGARLPNVPARDAQQARIQRINEENRRAYDARARN